MAGGGYAGQALLSGLPGLRGYPMAPTSPEGMDPSWTPVEGSWETGEVRLRLYAGGLEG